MYVLLARLKIFRAAGIWKSGTRSKSWNYAKTDDAIQALGETGNPEFGIVRAWV
jgi:hypothetical protein